MPLYVDDDGLPWAVLLRSVQAHDEFPFRRSATPIVHWPSVQALGQGDVDLEHVDAVERGNELAEAA